MGFGIRSPLDVDNDLVCIFRILFEVSLEKDEAVAIGRAVELASIPIST